MTRSADTNIGEFNILPIPKSKKEKGTLKEHEA